MTTTVLAYIPSPAQGVWQLGSVPLRAYALFIIVGIMAALIIGDRRWVARGGEPGVIYDVALWAVPFGLVGGRVYHVLTDWSTYFGEGGAGFAAALRIWEGGLGIWGAVALGGIGAWIACRRRGIPLPAFGDAIAPGIILAQAIGRLGNYFNQELFGRPTTLPWGLEIYERRNASGAIDSMNGVSTGQLIEVVHPTFLYELLWNLLIFVALIVIDRRFRIGHGRLFAMYVAGYCLGRFWIELMRSDTATLLAGIRINSFTSTFVFIAAVVYIMAAPRGREDPATLRGRQDTESQGEAEAISPAEELGVLESATGVVAAVQVAGGGDEAEPEESGGVDGADPDVDESDEVDAVAGAEVEEDEADSDESGVNEADEAESDESDVNEADEAESGEADSDVSAGSGDSVRGGIIRRWLRRTKPDESEESGEAGGTESDDSGAVGGAESDEAEVDEAGAVGVDEVDADAVDVDGVDADAVDVDEVESDESGAVGGAESDEGAADEAVEVDDVDAVEPDESGAAGEAESDEAGVDEAGEVDADEVDVDEAEPEVEAESDEVDGSEGEGQTGESSGAEDRSVEVPDAAEDDLVVDGAAAEGDPGDGLSATETPPGSGDSMQGGIIRRWLRRTRSDDSGEVGGAESDEAEVDEAGEVGVDEVESGEVGGVESDEAGVDEAVEVDVDEVESGEVGGAESDEGEADEAVEVDVDEVESGEVGEAEPEVAADSDEVDASEGEGQNGESSGAEDRSVEVPDAAEDDLVVDGAAAEGDTNDGRSGSEAPSGSGDSVQGGIIRRWLLRTKSDESDKVGGAESDEGEVDEAGEVDVDEVESGEVGGAESDEVEVDEAGEVDVDEVESGEVGGAESDEVEVDEAVEVDVDEVESGEVGGAESDEVEVDEAVEVDVDEAESGEVGGAESEADEVYVDEAEGRTGESSGAGDRSVEVPDAAEDALVADAGVAEGDAEDGLTSLETPTGSEHSVQGGLIRRWLRRRRSNS